MSEEEDLKAAIRAQVRLDLRQQMQQLEHQRSAKKPVLRRLWPWLAAAAVMGIVALFYWLQPKESSPQQLFASQFQPVENYYLPLERTATENSQLQQAFSYYEADSFAQAANLFRQVLAGEQQPEVSFYLANALMAQGQYEEAMQLLQNLDLLPAFAYAEAVDWLMALNLMATDDPAAAKSRLERIAGQDGHAYQEKAQLLLPSIAPTHKSDTERE